MGTLQFNNYLPFLFGIFLLFLVLSLHFVSRGTLVFVFDFYNYNLDLIRQFFENPLIFGGYLLMIFLHFFLSAISIFIYAWIYKDVDLSDVIVISLIPCSVLAFYFCYDFFTFILTPTTLPEEFTKLLPELFYLPKRLFNLFASLLLNVGINFLIFFFGGYSSLFLFKQ